MKYKTLILLILLIAGLIIGFISIKPSHVTKIITIGSAVPDFELVDAEDNRIRLHDMKGSVVLINFWATWCASCIEELPSIERLYRYLSAESRFRVVTILYRDDGSRALNFMKQNGLTFPVYVNPDNSAAKYFGITGVPETFLIDKKGVLRHKVIGPAEWDAPYAIEKIQAILNEP
ncbi:MAG: TlpA disulfide reductase family protein [Nitrospirota bacterium]